jgi:hypothetical protein
VAEALEKRSGAYRRVGVDPHGEGVEDEDHEVGVARV